VTGLNESRLPGPESSPQLDRLSLPAFSERDSEDMTDVERVRDSSREIRLFAMSLIPASRRSEMRKARVTV